MIRELNTEDIGRLKEIHLNAGYDYQFPDIAHPLFLNRIVSVVGDRILAAGLHRICYETFALVDPEARPQDKWAALRELDGELSNRAYWQGLELTHASVPPIGFDKRLKELGWQQDRPGYRLWSRETHA